MCEVLILLAACNGNRFIEEQLDSIINQDCSYWHLIVSDDGNNTSEILQEYEYTYPDRITHYKSGLQFGSAKSHFMHLLKVFGGKARYYMFCDQDDIWHSDKVRLTYDRLTSMESVYGKDVPMLVHTSYNIVDCDLNEISSLRKLQTHKSEKSYCLNRLLVFNMVTGCTMMLNNSLAELSNRDIPIDAITMHDWWIALLAAAFGKIEFLDKKTMDYRQHADNVVGSPNQLSLHYIKQNISLEELQSHLRQDSKQASVLLHYYSDLLDANQKEMLIDFSSIMTFSKFKRIAIYKKNDIFKPGFIRNIEQILFW